MRGSDIHPQRKPNLLPLMSHTNADHRIPAPERLYIGGLSPFVTIRIFFFFKCMLDIFLTQSDTETETSKRKCGNDEKILLFCVYTHKSEPGEILRFCCYIQHFTMFSILRNVIIMLI